MKYRLLAVLLVLALALAAAPVVAQEAAPAANLTGSCVETYDPNVDYFPDKATVEYAEGFTVEYFNHYKLVTVLTPWTDATEPFQYVLVQCGTPAPTDLDAPVIEVPVNTLVSMSTTFLPHIVSQGLLDRLVAVDSILYTNTQAVIDKFNAGDLPEVGGSATLTDPNTELLIDLQPDVIMTQRFSSSDTTYPVLEKTGLTIVVNADFLDTSPLGQAEWGKFISLFFNTEAQAQADFESMKARYQDLKALAGEVAARPTVLVGSPYNGTWFMPGGRSYVAQLLADAGADYLWAEDESTGSLYLDFETVLDRAADADYWVNVNMFWTDLNAVQSEDERYTTFAPFQNERLYSNNARSNENGGSDYFESGVANPDRILADLIKIFHPDLLPDHELYYYKQLTK